MLFFLVIELERRDIKRMNKKVLFGILMILSIAIPSIPIVFAYENVNGICFNVEKTIVCGPTTVPTFTNVQWLIQIAVQIGADADDVVVTDRLGAELEIDLPFPESISQGTASYYTKGGSDKVFLTWDIGHLDAYQWVALRFWISTDINPAGKQEYTSPGCYELNSGATLKFKVNGVQYSMSTPPIVITVVES